MYDVVVVGGGAAGFFTAINIKIKHPEFRVLIIEKSAKTLSKVLISGGGRCNVTHHCFDPAELVRYYPRGKGELLSVFNRFSPKDTIEWFRERGISLKTEADGRMFPESDNSSTIANCFLRMVQTNGIELRTSCGLKRIVKKEQTFVLETEQGTLQSRRLVMAGGSSQSLWNLVSELGHNIISPVPSLFTFNIRHPLIEDLMGTSFSAASVTLPGNEELIKRFKLKKQDLVQKGPMLITHWGLSGPAVLKTSSVAALLLNVLNYKFKIKVAFLDQKPEELDDVLKELKSQNPRKQVISQAPQGLTNRFWVRLCQVVLENPDLNWADISGKDRLKLAEALTGFVFEVNGKSTFKDEFVTAGGVDLKEVDFRTMESKLIPGLYFAGEILNIDALTGGFNFQACWSESWVISESV